MLDKLEKLEIKKAASVIDGHLKSAPLFLEFGKVARVENWGTLVAIMAGEQTALLPQRDADAEVVLAIARGLFRAQPQMA